MPAKRKRVPKKGAKRPTHAHVLGTSGAGKKRYLASVVKAQAESGQQFGILDPHGELSATTSHQNSPKKN